MREKCPNTGFFWSLFSHIGTEYGKLHLKSLYSVSTLQNKKQKSPYLNSSQVVCGQICGDLELIYCRNYYSPNFFEIHHFLGVQMRTNGYETSPYFTFFYLVYLIPLSYNTNRNNMQENLLLNARLSLQLA